MLRAGGLFAARRRFSGRLSPKNLTLCGDEREPRAFSFAKKAVAFFRMPPKSVPTTGSIGETLARLARESSLETASLVSPRTGVTYALRARAYSL